MWTYRNGPECASKTIISKPASLKSEKQPSHVYSSNIGTFSNRMPSANCSIKRTRKRSMDPFMRNSCFIYLSGLLIGSVCSKLCSQELLQYAKYYTENVLDLLLSQNYTLIFSNHYIASIVQLSVVLVSGFCAFGIVLIPLFVFLKGIGTGCFFSLLYLQLGVSKGLLGQLLFFFFPELISFLLLLLLCSSSWKVSKNLFSSCIRRNSSNLYGNCKSLLYRYLILCIIGLLPCVFQVVSSKLFAALFV